MLKIARKNHLGVWKLKEGIFEDQKDVLLNAIKLYDGRSRIIKLFGDKNIAPGDYPQNGKSEFEPKS